MEIIILFIIAISLVKCATSEEWSGHVYPNRGNLAVSRTIGTFESLERCRDEAESELIEMNALHRGDYECGLNCVYDNPYYTMVCEKTSK